MKSLTKLLVAVVLLSGTAFAQSAKYSLQVSSMELVAETPGLNGVPLDIADDTGWQDILETSIKTSQQKDLVAGVSLEAGLFTDTQVTSRYLKQVDAEATATVQVRVLIDDTVAEPGIVNFAERKQHLMAQFAGLLTCTDSLTVDTDGDGVADAVDGTVQYDECNFDDLDPETLQLWQKTINANAFFFALNDVGVGVHPVKVQARVITSKSVVTDYPGDASGSADAKAFVGKGALTVEEVRLVKGLDITL